MGKKSKKINPVYEKYFGKIFSEKELFELIFGSMKKQPYIRINTLKISQENAINLLKNMGVEATIVLDSPPMLKVVSGYKKLSRSIFVKKGYFYFQDIASILSVVELDPQKNEKILDVSAAPGGKTAAIAQLMENTGFIVANDVSEKRINAMKESLSNQGVLNCVVFKVDFTSEQTVRKLFADFKFDRILIDAPCTGSGLIGFKPNRYIIQNLKKINEYVSLQNKLIKNAITLLKKNGMLVYSTCSLTLEENEFLINNVLDEFDFVRLEQTRKAKKFMGKESITLQASISNHQDINKEILNKTTRLIPLKNDTIGFFISKLRKIKNSWLGESG